MASDAMKLPKILVAELGRVVEPVGSALEAASAGNFGELEALLYEMGLGENSLGELIGQIADSLTAVADAYSRLDTMVITPVENDEAPKVERIEDVVALAEDISTIVDAIQGLDELQPPQQSAAAIGDTVVDHLLVRYLYTYHRRLHDVLCLTGIVEKEYVTNPGGRIHFDRLGTVLDDPIGPAKQSFEWGTEEFQAIQILQLVRSLLMSFQFPSELVPAPASRTVGASPTGQQGNANPNTGKNPGGGQMTPADAPTALYIPLISFSDSGARASVGITIQHLPGKKSVKPGLALMPVGSAKYSKTFDLGNGWEFVFESAADIDEYGLVMRPNTKPEFKRVFGKGSGVGDARVTGTLKWGPSAQSDSGTVLVGSENGTNLSLLSVGLGATGSYDGSEFSAGAEIPSKGKLTINPQGGFLAKVLPSPITSEFSTTVGWSMADGFYFESGATLEVPIPTHTKIGPIELREIYLAALTGQSDADLRIDAAASPKLSLGPLTANVKRMGVSADVSFSKSGGGNLGPVDLDVGFRPPDGLGLKLEAGAVSGGGYLAFEPEKNRYAGTFNLSFNDYSVTVVGLLKTELPGSQDGYSLLLLVTGQMPPIQLGFGFTLNGIGGLVGAHRDMRKGPLRKSVKTGSLDSVLFPENVVENSTQIISDLRTIFPPTSDVYVVGPMAKFGWGTPTLITMDVGVVLAIPKWVIAILGKISMVMPTEEKAIVDLNLGLVGILDIPGKKLSIDASLYDSKVALFDVSGDMAMRSSWGKQSRFMLSVGGFHPKYEPPKSFPQLRRVKANLSKGGGQVKITLSAYLAVTPNTFQVGAGVVAHAELGPATVDGELSFDALFRFNPFEFVIDFYAKLMVAIKSFKLGIEVDGTLSGPKPWALKGKVRIEIAFVSVTVNIDVSIGSKPDEGKLPSAKVMPELKRAIGQTANWDAQRPEGPATPVSLRDPTQDGSGGGGGGGGGGGKPQPETVLVHPLGTIRVRQTVVPLGVTLEKYGNAKPVNARFELTKLTMSANTLPAAGTLREKFAPAKFKQMSDSEKLNSQGFEKLPAGRVVENDLCYYTGQIPDGANLTASEKQKRKRLVKAATLSYESSVIDEKRDNYRLKPSDKDGWTVDANLNVHDTHRLANTGAAAVSEARTSGSAKYQNRAERTRESTDFTVSDTRYVVVTAEKLTRVDMSNVSGVDNPADGTTQVEAEETRDAYASKRPGDDVTVVPTHEARNSGGGS